MSGRSPEWAWAQTGAMVDLKVDERNAVRPDLRATDHLVQKEKRSVWVYVGLAVLLVVVTLVIAFW